MTLWIESHTTLGSHPKTRRLARRLDISIPTAVGVLHLLWHHVIVYADDGDLSEFDAEDIAVAAQWDGDPEAFRAALVEEGWIDEDDDGARVHDWHTYAGRLLEARRAAQEGGQRGNHQRWHVARGKLDPTCRYCASDSESGATSGGDSGSESGANRTVPNRTVPNPNPTTTTSGGDSGSDTKLRAALVKGGCSDEAADYALRELALRREADEEIRSPLGWCKKVAADYTKQRPSCVRCGATRVSLVNTDRGAMCMECRRRLDGEDGKRASHG